MTTIAGQSSLSLKDGARIDLVDATIQSLHADHGTTGDRGEWVDIRDFAISAEAGEVLERAVHALAPAASIEVGCASALSSLYICRGRMRAGSLRENSVHVMDPKQTSHWKNIGRRSLMRAGLLDTAVSLYEEPAHAVLPRLLAEGKRVQFAFIDGWHMLDYVMVEAFYCDLMMDVGGIIALHDLWMPGLQAFAAFWSTNRRYVPVRWHDGELTSDAPAPVKPLRPDLVSPFPPFNESAAPFVEQGILLLRKTAEDDRKWDAFRDFSYHPPKT